MGRWFDTHTIYIQPTGRIYFIPASSVVQLTGITVSGSKSLTLTWSGAVTAGSFVAGNFLVNHGGTLVPATSVAQGAANTLVITATGFQANPSGDTVFVGAAPSGVRAPVLMTVS